MDKLFVVNSNGEKSDFQPILIKKAIIDETGLDNDKAERIKKSIAKKLNKLKREDGLNEVSTSTIRAEVSSQLLKIGEVDAEKKSRKLGMSVSQYEQLVHDGDRQNANKNYSPEMIQLYAAESIQKEYALQTMPHEVAKAYTDGYIHIHDLASYNLKPNCLNHDLRFYARNGLKIDGRGIHGSVAKPAKSLEVLLNHMLQAWMAAAVCLSGGQGYVSFNTLLSPYAEGRKYDDIKQAIQMFIFNCNMSTICRGGDLLFSSIALDLSCPHFLADEEAVGIGGVLTGKTYKEYQSEADLIFRAVCEVIAERDGEGKVHRFPNTLYNIRGGDLDEYTGNCKLLFDLGANNSQIYYVNCYDGEKTLMGCRTSLLPNYTRDNELDMFNTGNFAYYSLNLPLIAKESDSVDKFMVKLNEYVELCYKGLNHRLECVRDAIYNLHLSDFLIQEDKDTGVPLYDLDRPSLTIGYVGLNEAVLELIGSDLTDENGENLGVTIVQFLNDKADEFKQREKDNGETPKRWGVIASPAESTASRFAKINRFKYSDAVVQGDHEGIYLTNSHHIPVGAEENWIKHIRNADKFHRLSRAGAILHLWTGEAYSDPKALWSLMRKIIEQTSAQFIAFTKDFTYCQECAYTLNKRLDVCPICDSTDLIWYSRVTGYYVPISSWNDGKKNELEDRNYQTFKEQNT